MKLHIDIDCTPEEARRTLGLADVAPLQDAMMEVLRERMMAFAAETDPAELMRTWMSGAGWEAMRKAWVKPDSGGGST